jgi:mono/diheme cytochrome c family protein
MQTDINTWRKRFCNGRIFIVLVAVMIFASCNRRPNHPGWDFFPDMFYSPAYQTWTENPVLEDEKTLQPPVEGTIPRNMIPFQYERTEEDRERAGRELVNPFTGTAEVVERGRQVYSVYCMVCHGEKGDGLGHIFTSGRYLVPPASLINETVRDLPDGNIYHVISLGVGVMAEHATLILPEDRWRAINYIRVELQGQEIQED